MDGKEIESKIYVTVEKNKKPESHYVLVIEDKTTSSAHSGQLRKYANIMDSWNTKEPNYKDRRFKIFYKVDSIIFF